MRLAHFEIDQLKVLPMRAIVAFSARCARRVESLAQLPEGHPLKESRREAVAAAIRMAEAFANGSDAPPDESAVAAADASREAGDDLPGSDAVAAAAQAARAAATAWHVGSLAAENAGAPGKHTPRGAGALDPLAHVTADLAAMNAYTAAADAFLSVGYHNERFVDAALRDYDALVRLKLGRFPEPGDPVDPSPEGPLGPL